MEYLLENFPLPVRGTPPDVDEKLREHIAEHLRRPPEAIRSYRILQRSVDSRRELRFIYKIVLDSPETLPLPDASEAAALFDAGVELPEKIVAAACPLVVGTGPAGVFAALILAEAGLKPVVLDRGFPMERRVEDRKKFLETRVLDPESNLLIGEGGAGAFSDGKLYTGTRDPFGRFVIRTLVEAGAPSEILYRARPHVGSDFLRKIGIALRKKIESLGGTFLFGANVRDVLVSNGRCAGVKLASGETLPAPQTLLAPGLGGRDLVRTLCKKVACERKPFQTGCRIVHWQHWVDSRQYHGARPEALGAAEYHLAGRPAPDRPQVSSFCMCPGGRIVNASAWEKRSATNGASDYARDGKFANSCLIITVPPDGIGGVEDVWEWIERRESALFEAGGGDYAFPAQDARAFLAGRAGLSQRDAGAETGIVPGRLDLLAGKKLFFALGAALADFDRKMPGFIREGTLVGLEPCVSSPVRIVRNDFFMSDMPNLFVAGEGAGAAGGIVSAACDGIRAALAMCRNPKA